MLKDYSACSRCHACIWMQARDHSCSHQDKIDFHTGSRAHIDVGVIHAHGHLLTGKALVCVPPLPVHVSFLLQAGLIAQQGLNGSRPAPHKPTIILQRDARGCIRLCTFVKALHASRTLCRCSFVYHSGPDANQVGSAGIQTRMGSMPLHIENRSSIQARC